MILHDHGLNSWLAPFMEDSVNLGDLGKDIYITLTRCAFLSIC